MMLEWSADDFIKIVQFLGLAVLGAFWVLGGRYGTKTTTHAERSVEVAGALVDSGSVKELTSALTAHTAECAAMRRDAERTRKIGHELVEAVERLTKELSEIRDELRLKRR